MNLKNTIIAISFVFITALVFTEGEPEPYAQWEYEGELGQKNWSKLDERFQMCENGLNQSPINITRPIDASLSPLIFEELGKATTFINNEHMLQVNFQGVNSVTIDDKRYNLKQINFHSPSENKINGKSFPMEAQLIHMDSNNNPLIIALMFQEGDDNFILNRLLRNLPKKANVIEEIKSEVLAYKILPDLKEYYLFNGSITTPPCTEGVKWLVLKNPVQISKSQLKDFTLNIPKNARDTQKLNARIILE